MNHSGMYLNFHTHQPLAEGEVTIPSYGLHPWYLTDRWQEELDEMAQGFDSSTRFLIGECGLDRVCTTPYDRQLAAFEAQIALSEQWERPLVLHCVRALDDVLRLKHGTRQPWIFHGFRGKPQQLEQLIAHGFHVSFGLHHNAESLRACPAERLFLETDDQPVPIAPLYEQAAQQRKTTTAGLREQLWRNVETIFL